MTTANKTKMVFNVNFTPSLIHDVGKVMSGLDLGISGLTMPIDEEVSFFTSTKITEKYIKMVISILRESYEKSGNVVHEIKHISQGE